VGDAEIAKIDRPELFTGSLISLKLSIINVTFEGSGTGVGSGVGSAVFKEVFEAGSF
jgi:hypothetical protein